MRCMWKVEQLSWGLGLVENQSWVGDLLLINWEHRLRLYDLLLLLLYAKTSLVDTMCWNFI